MTKRPLSLWLSIVTLADDITYLTLRLPWKGGQVPPSYPHPLFPTPTPSPSSSSLRLGNEDREVEPGRGSKLHTFRGLGVARF